MGIPLANEWAKLTKSFVEHYYGKIFARRLFIQRGIFIVRKCYSHRYPYMPLFFLTLSFCLKKSLKALLIIATLRAVRVKNKIGT